MSKESPTRKSAAAGAQNRDRDKRFLGTIQSALGNSPNRNRKQREARTTVAPESEITLSDALEQISISNEDASISLAGIKPIIRQKADQFTKEEFAQIAETLCQSAVEQTNVYFVLEICTELIEYENFQSAISECLTELVGKFLRQEAEEKFESIPSVLAQFMVNRWPRNFDKAIEGSNLILFTIYSTIMGWIEFVKSQLKNDQQQQSSIAENGENTNESNILLKSIQGILSVCMNGQRYLWLNYPELFNGIYDLTVEILVSNIILPRSVKSSLLMLYQQMGKWSQTNAQTKTPKYLNATTQTVR